MSIYKRFCKEEFDENGRLKKLTLDYPDNFNFAYDVVDAIAEEEPDKRAIVCGQRHEGRRHRKRRQGHDIPETSLGVLDSHSCHA